MFYEAIGFSLKPPKQWNKNWFWLFESQVLGDRLTFGFHEKWGLWTPTVGFPGTRNDWKAAKDAIIFFFWGGEGLRKKKHHTSKGVKPLFEENRVWAELIGLVYSCSVM